MIEKLIEQIAKKNSPIVVGLDPMLDYIPEKIKNDAFEKNGKTLEGIASAIITYNQKIIDAIYDLVPAVKPQIAMYEQFGIPGMIAFSRTVKMAKDRGLIVIGDVKRGDIGSTSKAYAAAHLGHIDIGGFKLNVFNEDFATVNPYLGIDGIKPFMDVCKEDNKGIFVLVKTSNPSSAEFQDRIIKSDFVEPESRVGEKLTSISLSDGNANSSIRLYEQVALKVDEWGKELMHGDYSDVGAVTGATYPEEGAALRKLMPNTYFLVPGYGAQGGRGSDLAGFFNKDGLGAIVNSSRGIIAAYKSEKYSRYGEENFADASRMAVIAMQKDINDNIHA